MNVIKIVETYFIFHLQRLIPTLGNPYATITKKKKKKNWQVATAILPLLSTA